MERIRRSDVKRETTKCSAKASTKIRLKKLADLIGASIPSSDVLEGLAQATARFPDEVVDSACRTLENAPQPDFRRMPTPYELVQACEKAGAKPKIGDCGICNNTRLLIQESNGKREAVRCECWKKWKAA